MYHKYYQWVPFMLALSAVLFYLPMFAWRQCEGLYEMGKCCAEIDKEGQNMRSLTFDDELTVKRITRILQYYLRGNWHLRYTFTLIGCEFLNGIVVIVVWFLTDYFLDYQFQYFGGDYHKFFNGLLTIGQKEPSNNVVDYGPLDAVFPKVTKCTFHTFGFSGTQQRLDGLCVLPLNIVNEKCYLILWFWYIICGVICLINIIRRVVMILASDVMV